MMKALIVEDEKMAKANLARIISSNFPDIEIAGMTSSVKETLSWLRDPANKADVIFMDVELSDGECFEIFRQQKIDAQVIMTTAYDSYAVKAFQAGSIDYLLKPIEIDDLSRAVRRCRQRSTSIDIGALMEAFAHKEGASRKERFIVHLGERIIPVKVSEIAYFFSEDKCNYLVTGDGARYIIDSSMDSIIGETDPAKFFRISRSCIVAMSAIKSVNKQFGGRLKVIATPEPPFEMTVSRARVDDFLAWLE